MTRKVTRNYSLSVVAPFFAILIVLTAQASTPPLFLPAVPFDSGGQGIQSIAVADVNGDGKPDLVVAIGGSNGVGVLLGNGYGWFQPPVTYQSGGAGAGSVAVADVNGDGKPDLIVSNGIGVAVLLGNGDGTFQPAVTYSSGGDALSLAVADVNGDGKLDVVVTNENSNTVGVMLGNGDGTFQPVVVYGSGGGWTFGVAVADVNGDGNPDIVVANNFAEGQWGATVGVLLGNGDGTFQNAVNYNLGGPPWSLSFFVVVRDVNGDGKPDLLVTNNCRGPCPSGWVAVLLGNGDGTFQPPVLYDQAEPISIAVADVDGDGKLDLLVANFGPHGNDGWIGVLTGNGDGTFQAGAVYRSRGQAASVVVADVNADGYADLLVANVASSPPAPPAGVGVLLRNTQHTTSTKLASSPNPSTYGQAVTFTAKVASSHGPIPDGGFVAFYNGSKMLGRGTLAGGTAAYTTSLYATAHVSAVYTGDALLMISRGAMKQVVEPLPTTTALVSSVNPSSHGQAVTFTATVTSAGPTPTGRVKFLDGTTGIGSPKLSGGVATLTRSTLTVGTHPITAEYLGDAYHAKSTSPVLNQVVQ